ncbi:RNA methyltransferase [Vulgatibacter sp.]|uniref:RNA methyltransferase n=1 Tax=Vulgatibacter sp. TaxID=1971226 RepID=UPI0035626A08
MAGDVGIVLYKPRIADNVGGVARAMVNFGFDRMVIADPATYHFDTRTAVKSERVVENAYIARTFEEAVAPFTWVCGTTSRVIRRRAALSPRQMAEEAFRRVQAGGTVCVVLGSENHGLTDADVDRCDAICRIDTDEEQPSINLAQAAAILCYELHVAQRQERLPRQQATMASRESVDRLVDFARTMLLDAGFLNPQQPHLILAELRRLLVRGEPTKREVELLTAAVKQVQRSLVPVPQRKGP